MGDLTIDVAAARLGTALPGARSPWTHDAIAGADYALGQGTVPAGGRLNGRHAAFWQAPAPRTAQRMARRTAQRPVQQAQPVALKAEPLPTTGTASVTVNRKPSNVHKTRINAGGYGAMGPYPERERLA